MLTFAEAHELFEYKDGELFSKVGRGKLKKGQKIGCVNGKGYKQTLYKGKIYTIHRIIFLMQHGNLPKFIDHIDGNRTNNRIENLREATHQQNCWNMSFSTRNSSGIKGVSWNKQRKQWIAQVGINGKPMYFGGYKDLELAELVVQMAREKYHGKYTNHGVKIYG